MKEPISEKLAMEAMKYLKPRDRTRAEVWSFLQKYAQSHSEAEETMIWLENRGYVNDLRYADYYIRGAMEKGFSQNRIRKKLLEKGIEEGTIQKAFSAYGEEREVDLSQLEAEEALAEANRLMKKEGYSRKTLRKIASRLAYLGYEETLIYELLENLENSQTLF